jgi:hypothetical protein
MKRNIALAFLICQLLGELFAWAAPHITGPAGPWLWVASIILLFPGDHIATWVIEKLLWTSGLHFATLQFLKALLEFPINAAVWAALALPWIHSGARCRTRNAGSTGG